MKRKNIFVYKRMGYPVINSESGNMEMLPVGYMVNLDSGNMPVRFHSLTFEELKFAIKSAGSCRNGLIKGTDFVFTDGRFEDEFDSYTPVLRKDKSLNGSLTYSDGILLKIQELEEKYNTPIEVFEKWFEEFGVKITFTPKEDSK